MIPQNSAEAGNSLGRRVGAVRCPHCNLVILAGDNQNHDEDDIQEVLPADQSLDDKVSSHAKGWIQNQILKFLVKILFLLVFLPCIGVGGLIEEAENPDGMSYTGLFVGMIVCGLLVWLFFQQFPLHEKCPTNGKFAEVVS